MLDHSVILGSQYHATLAMLKQAVEKCPPELWDDPQDRNKFWHAAYHALFYTHLYLSTTGAEFKPWVQHREDYQFFGPKPWPPHDLPKIGESYTPAEILAYLQVCWDFVDAQMPGLDLEAPSGFDWLPMNKLELQLYNIRHLQQHTGELMERLGSRARVDVSWVGAGMTSIDWLLENGGPIVRWRVGNELIPGISNAQKDALAHELIAAPLVQEWLGRLTLEDFSTPLDSLNAASLGWLGNIVHGGKASCLENVLGKLSEFGLRLGMTGLDECALPLMQIFRWSPSWKNDAIFQNAWETLVKSVFAWGLLRLGYPPDEPMKAWLLSHLDVCQKIVRDRVYDLYADDAELTGLPKAWRGKPILKQEVMANYWLPYIHDLYVFANFPAELLNETARQKIDELVAYILDPRFQALHDGYGYAWIKERHACYGWGWSPHFKDNATRVQRLELMAHFPWARQSPWFQESLQAVEGFRTPEGRYRLPGEYLRESEGYYVSGFGMGLGENRRKSLSIEIESTFRMLQIQQLQTSV